MSVDPFIARAAALIGNPVRANILFALKDDRSLTSTELSFVAGTAPQTASGHLAMLVDGGLVTRSRQGRHQFFRLANDRVADALEALEALSSSNASRHRSHRSDETGVRFARTCYDHLAGSLGVALASALVDQGYLAPRDRDFVATPRGIAGFGDLGIETVKLEHGRRRFATRCVDWSESRPHVGGALGAALLGRFVDLGWIVRRPRTRAVLLGPDGRAALSRLLDLDLRPAMAGAPKERDALES